MPVSVCIRRKSREDVPPALPDSVWWRLRRRARRPGHLLALAGSAQGTAISVAIDMQEGIIARFRTMAIARVSVLTGHVVGNVIQTMLGVALVIGVALLVGFRPVAGLVEWIAAIALLAVTALGLTWLSVALGLAAKSVESASNTPMILLLLPFLGSGFVPTDGMPVGLCWFAEYQPFTSIIETLRGLAAITFGGYIWEEAVQPRTCCGIGTSWAGGRNRFPPPAFAT